MDISFVNNLISLGDYNLPEWKLICVPFSKRIAGQCCYDDKIIRISSFFAEINEEKHVLNWIKHEIAHALTPGHHHDKVWKKQAKLFGIEPNSRFVEGRDGILPLGRYQADCPNCKFRYSMIKVSCKKYYWCLKCGRIKGLLVFK